MSKYKIIFSDIDGTLLNSKHEITEKTKYAVSATAKEKIPVILVSARMPKGIIFLQKQLNISEPIICYSGALVIDSKSNILLNKNISGELIKKIYNEIEGKGIHISLYKDNEWYIENMDEWSKQESEITGIEPIIVKFKSLFQLWEDEKLGANKILCMGQPEVMKKLLIKFKELFEDDLNIYPSKPTYLEIMPKSASKTSAIEFLIKKFSIDKSEIIAIGDNYNDIDMIEYAQLGIAMGNAPDEVKQYANEITLSNDEDGLAEAVKKYILSN